MATVTMATVDNILKEVYEDGGINDQLQSEITAFKRIERSSEGVTHEVGGKYVRFPIRTKRNHGMGARNENEPLPVARTQSYESAQVQLKYLYGALQLTGQTMELADKNFQAFASALDEEVTGMREGLKKDVARQCYGTNAGILGTATAAGTTTTFVLPNEEAMYFEEGMIVDLYDVGDTLKLAGAEITLVEAGAANTTITFTPADAVVTAVDDYMTRESSGGKEMTGLQQIVNDTGAIYDIDPATVPVWKSVVDDNGGANRALTELLMIAQVDAIRRKGGGSPSVIFASLGVRRAYFELLQQERRVISPKEFTGGFTGLAFTVDDKEIPLVSDVDCQPNRMYFLNEKEIKLYNAGDWSFMDRDGSKWQRVITSAGSFDAYQATLFQYAEIGTHRRNSHALLTDLTEA